MKRRTTFKRLIYYYYYIHTHQVFCWFPEYHSYDREYTLHNKVITEHNYSGVRPTTTKSSSVSIKTSDRQIGMLRHFSRILSIFTTHGFLNDKRDWLVRNKNKTRRVFKYCTNNVYLRKSIIIVLNWRFRSPLFQRYTTVFCFRKNIN